MNMPIHKCNQQQLLAHRKHRKLLQKKKLLCLLCCEVCFKAAYGGTSNGIIKVYNLYAHCLQMIFFNTILKA